MKDIHEVLRRKQAKYAQLAKQIEALQQAAEKLREVAPLLAENEEDDNVVLAEMDEERFSPAPWQPRLRLHRAVPHLPVGPPSRAPLAVKESLSFESERRHDSSGIAGFERR